MLALSQIELIALLSFGGLVMTIFFCALDRAATDRAWHSCPNCSQLGSRPGLCDSCRTRRNKVEREIVEMQPK